MKRKYSLMMPYRNEEVDAMSPPAGSGDEGDAVVPPVETPPEDHGNDTVDAIQTWDQLDQEFDADDSEITEQEPTPEVAEPSAEETPVVTDEPEAEPAAVETTPPAQEPPADTTDQTPVVEEPQPTSEEAAAAETARANALRDNLEERYSLTEEQALQMVTEPAKVMPKLQAQLFTDVYEAVMNTMRQQLPDAIEYNIQSTSVKKEKADQFYEAWPKLSKREHATTIAQVAEMYGKLNPGASEQDVIRDVGMQVMFKFGIQPDLDPQQQQQQQTPPPPRQPASVNGAFTPPQGLNEWEAMSQDLLDDEDI